jgi:soluble lytic murein transglycosylase-like protein
MRLVRQGVPPEVADAVVVESAYNPHAVGTVGEIGLMQVRPTTAAMLGHTGAIADLHEPSTNREDPPAFLPRGLSAASA